MNTTENTTIENNKIIAEFMGWKLGHPDLFELRWSNDWFKGRDKKTNKGYLFFDSDWNWLMEVIKVIKQKYCFANINISTGETSISIFDINGENHFTTCPKNNYEGATMLSVTYKAVVNFIEWYNEQKS